MRSRFGYIQKESDTKYRAFWSENKSRKSKRFRTYKEASQFLAYKQVIGTEIDSEITYKNYYESAIIPTYKNLSTRTKYEYKRSWERLKPHISDIPIKKTTWRLVQSVIDEIDTPIKQRKDLAFWRRMLNFAVHDQIIPGNTFTDRISTRKEIRKEKKLWTKEELVDVLNTVRGTEFAMPILMECVCGLRHEEFCGLNRRDFIPLEGKWIQIYIDRALTSVSGKKILKEAKTATSHRTVVIPPCFFDYVHDHLEFIKNKRYIKEYISPQTYTAHWRNYCKKTGTNHVTFGHMRSVYATLSAEAGCIDSVVSLSMGHSDGSVRSKNYQKATLQALRINATIFQEYLGYTYSK